MFAICPDPSFVLDADGRVCRANKAAAEMHGCTIDQLVGRNISELDDPASASKAGERIARCLAGERLHFKVQHVLPNGQRVPLEVFAAPFDDNGQKRLIAIDRDITPLVHAEQIIAESAERPGLALRSANQGLYDLNVQTGACVVSDEYVTMLGYNPADFTETNQDWMARLHPDDQPAVSQAYRDYIAGKIEDYRVEFRLPMKDGRWKWILSIGKIVEYDERGKPLRMIGTHTDISDIKAAQDIIRKDAERPRLALSSAKHGVWDLHLPTKQTQVSDEYATMLGYDPEGFSETKASFIERVHPEDEQAVQERFHEYLSGKSDRFRVEFRLKHRAGHWVWLQTVGKLVEWDANGEPVRVIGTCTDITEMKEAELQLVQRQRQLARIGRLSLAEGLASTVAHELNQPLCAVVNYLAAIEHDLTRQPLRIEHARTNARWARDAAHRAGEIIQRFRRLFDKHTHDARPVSLPALIQQCLRLVAGELRHNNIRVIEQHPPDLPDVLADEILIQQVLLNLIQNAIDAMADTPDDQRELGLALDTTDGGATVRLRVNDTGRGLSKDAVDRLFEANPSDKPNGLGMGLCICRLIVKSHGGDIRLERTSEQGTVFAVCLPAARSQP